MYNKVKLHKIKMRAQGISFTCMCSAQTGNLRKPRIALRKLGIPALPRKAEISLTIGTLSVGYLVKYLET